MDNGSKIITNRLKYPGNSFPEYKWIELLKQFKTDFYTSRNDRLWYAIRGKGYIIWISSFSPLRDTNTIWYSDIEINKNASDLGRKTLKELLEAALTTFDSMEVEIINE